METKPSKPYRPRRGLRMREVERKVGLKKTQILDAVAQGRFPRPFHPLPGGRAQAWDEQEIDEHLEKQMAERDTRRQP
jgi:predicted DNA-binding transcriptional regulator AlpA